MGTKKKFCHEFRSSSIVLKHVLYLIAASMALGCKIKNKTVSVLKKLTVRGGRPTYQQTAAI